MALPPFLFVGNQQHGCTYDSAHKLHDSQEKPGAGTGIRQRETLCIDYLQRHLKIVRGDLIDNPQYIGGFKRTVYEFIYDFLPTGQSIQLNNMEFENAARWPWLSVIMLLISTFAGYIPFRKCDIR